MRDPQEEKDLSHLHLESFINFLKVKVTFLFILISS